MFDLGNPEALPIPRGQRNTPPPVVGRVGSFRLEQREVASGALRVEATGKLVSPRGETKLELAEPRIRFLLSLIHI